MTGCAPEREDKILSLWRQYNPDVLIKDDAKHITLNADRERIAFDAKTMDVFWLIGFGGWKAIECYSPHVILSVAQNVPVVDLMKRDEELGVVEREYKERLATVQSLIGAKDSSLVHWPPDLPRPNSDRDACNDLQYQAAFDLTCMAVGFTMFHEFRHVMLDQDGERQKDRREEELVCDVWAREFMTAKLMSYCESHNHNYHEVLRKRSMGFALAALILHEVTPFLEHGGNCDYFSVRSRLETILDNTTLPDNDYFWVFTASLLIGIFRQKGRVIYDNAPTASAQALAQYLLNTL